MAALAGVNLNCGYIYKHIPDAIAKGLITEATVDSILRPLLKTRFRLGLFDPPEMVPWSNLGPEAVNSPEHRALAYEAAVKSIVLLQNKNQVLPLKRDSILNIFVTGPTSADVMALVGNYNGWSGDMVTFLEGIISAVDVGTVVDYSQGCFMNTPGSYTGFWEAKMADILFGNANPSGRLPVTFYKSVDDLPSFDNYLMEGRTYRFFKGDPLFPFGYGLSYTTFEYQSMGAEKGIFTEGDKIHAELTIINTGDRAGETRIIPIEADLMNMHQWDEANQRYFVEKGNYILQINPCGVGGFMMQVKME